jgi:hypothetical protein
MPNSQVRVNNWPHPHLELSTETSNSYPPKRVDGNNNPDVDSGSPYSHHYEPTAEIWKLYLKETEAEDMELAQLWQIGLDQLLIFVGKVSFLRLDCSKYSRQVYSAQFLPPSSLKVARISKQTFSSKFFRRSTTIPLHRFGPPGHPYS